MDDSQSSTLFVFPQIHLSTFITNQNALQGYPLRYI